MAKTEAILTVDGDAQSGSLRDNRVTRGVCRPGHERGNDALLQRFQHVYLVSRGGPARPPLLPGLSRWPPGLVVPPRVGCQAHQFFPQLAQLLVVETIPGVQLLLELQ